MVASQTPPYSAARCCRSPKELKAQARGVDGEADALGKIAEIPQDERLLATRFHELVKAAAPGLSIKTWYGMPAYATPGKKGKVVCYFQGGAKMQTHYCTVGFNEAAHLDDGSLWATSFAITAWNATNEATLTTLLRRAVD